MVLSRRGISCFSLWVGLEPRQVLAIRLELLNCFFHEFRVVLGSLWSNCSMSCPKVWLSIMLWKNVMSQSSSYIVSFRPSSRSSSHSSRTDKRLFLCGGGRVSSWLPKIIANLAYLLVWTWAWVVFGARISFRRTNRLVMPWAVPLGGDVSPWPVERLPWKRTLTSSTTHMTLEVGFANEISVHKLRQWRKAGFAEQSCQHECFIHSSLCLFHLRIVR